MLVDCIVEAGHSAVVAALAAAAAVGIAAMRSVLGTVVARSRSVAAVAADFADFAY